MIGKPLALNFKVDEFTNKFGKLGKIKFGINSEPALKTWFVRDLSIFQMTSSCLRAVWKIVKIQKVIHCYTVGELK